MFQLRNRNNEPKTNEFKSNQNEIEYRATPTTPKPNTNDIIKPTAITTNEIQHTMNIDVYIWGTYAATFSTGFYLISIKSSSCTL